VTRNYSLDEAAGLSRDGLDCALTPETTRRDEGDRDTQSRLLILQPICLALGNGGCRTQPTSLARCSHECAPAWARNTTKERRTVDIELSYRIHSQVMKRAVRAEERPQHNKADVKPPLPDCDLLAFSLQ
jgi:hypothetical protein